MAGTCGDSEDCAVGDTCEQNVCYRSCATSADCASTRRGDKVCSADAGNICVRECGQDTCKRGYECSETLKVCLKPRKSG